MSSAFEGMSQQPMGQRSGVRMFSGGGSGSAMRDIFTWNGAHEQAQAPPTHGRRSSGSHDIGAGRTQGGEYVSTSAASFNAAPPQSNVIAHGRRSNGAANRQTYNILTGE